MESNIERRNSYVDCLKFIMSIFNVMYHYNYYRCGWKSIWIAPFVDYILLIFLYI